jgi:hypothetical protein
MQTLAVRVPYFSIPEVKVNNLDNHGKPTHADSYSQESKLYFDHCA